MKYYRCPHCGEPGISALYKNLMARTHYLFINMRFEDIIQKDKGEICSCCNKPYVLRPRYSTSLYVLTYILARFVFPVAWIIASLIVENRVDLFLGIMMFLFSPAVIYGVGCLPKLLCAPVASDKETLQKIDRLSNVSVELLEIAKNIHNYDIHAIKFDAKTENIRFKETFFHERVPIMFFKKKRAQVSRVEAYIIKKEFVPDDVLFVGSSFSIIDLKGTVIGRGKIHKIYQ